MRTIVRALAWGTVIGAVPVALFAVLLAAMIVLAHFRLIPPMDPPSWEERDRIAAAAQERLERARAVQAGTGRVLPLAWRCLSTVECERLTP